MATNLRILLVDDHEHSLAALSRLLKGAGHAVTAAGSFVDAVAAGGRMPAIDLLLSDIGLPDGNGCDLLRLLKEHQSGGPRFSVAMTGHDDEQWGEECRRAGYSKFLVKPVVFAELSAAIDELPDACKLPALHAEGPRCSA